MKKMKFLLGALSFMAAAFMASPSQAQVKTYLSEDFESGALDPAVWDLSACSLINSQIGYLFFLNDGSSSFGSYVYDPNGSYLKNGSSVIINGLYELVSNPLSISSEVANYISVDLELVTTKKVSDRKFGIRLREKGDTEWSDTVGEVILDTLSYQSSLMLPVDEKWAGKSNVELGVYFYNKHDEESSFLLLIDNIQFTAYALIPAISTNLIATPIVYGDSCDLKLAVSNTSTESINNVEYAYTIDGTKTGIAVLTFEKELAAFSGEVTTSIKIDLTGLELGNHALKIHPAKINGNAVTAAPEDTIKWAFTLVDESLLSQNYVPLMECFTASWCGPCASMNRYLNTTLEELKDAGKISVIKYQAYGDKYYLSAGDIRCAVYKDFDGYGYIPFPIYNGEASIMTWSSYYNVMMSTLSEKATADHKKKALAAIEITKAEADAETGRFVLNFSVSTAFSGQASVFAALIEKTTTGNRGSNGEREFHWVAMDMPTTGYGKLTSFEAGTAQSFDYSVLLERTHMEEITDLEVVCFVQNLETREIYQSASADVLALNVVANKNNEAARIAMYPNPAKGQVTLQGLNHADITIHDLTGRVAYSVKGAEGSLNINLDSFTAGTYMVRISQNGQTAHKKLVVVK